MRTFRTQRGFSLVTVLILLVILTTVGGMTLSMTGGDSATANARTKRTQALSAAEAGLSNYVGIAQPGKITNTETYLLGSESSYQWLPAVLDANGTTLMSRYRIRSNGPGALVRSGNVVVEGEVLDGDRVVGRALLGAMLLTEIKESPYSGTKNLSPSGAGFQRNDSGSPNLIGP